MDKKKEFSLGTGCDLFRPVLSSNGFCYSFNGQYSSNVWIDSDIHRTFRNLHNDTHTQENFGGAGVAEGTICSNLFVKCIPSYLKKCCIQSHNINVQIGVVHGSLKECNNSQVKR